MHKTQKEAQNFVRSLASLVPMSYKRIFLAVPFTALAHAAEAAGQTRIIIGAQNMHDHADGAFTGEISARMLKEAGGSFVLLGHSERRHLFGETDAFINRKLCRALAEEVLPILCIGETLEEKKEGLTESILFKQLEEGLKGVSAAQMTQTLIAYEPVWAIGTGETLDPKGAQTIHLVLRNFLKNRYDTKTAEKVSLLYGGSVKPDNAALLMEQADIDGLLVGGASLDVQTFVKIINF